MKQAICVGLQLSLSLLLVACSQPAPDPSTPAQATTAGAAAVTVPAEDPVAARPAQAQALFAQAALAMRDRRWFEPAGDNAFELYLALLEAEQGASAGSGPNPASRRLADAIGNGDLGTQARQVLTDLAPYGMVWVEQALRNGDHGGARRVLDLLARAQPGSDALVRLEQAWQRAVEGPPGVIAATATPAPPSTPPVATVVSTTAAARASAAVAAADKPPEPTPGDAGAVPPQPQASTPALADTDPPATPAAAAPLPGPSVEPPPELLQSPPPRYPPRAQRQRIEGWVAVAFAILPDGSVDQVRVTGSEPAAVFDREAIAAVRRWRYRAPGRQIEVERRINFLLGPTS